MRRILIATGAAALIALMAVASVAAAGPAGRAGAPAVGARTDVVAPILKLTQAQVQELRQDGLSLAQIAERQKVAPQKLIDALVAQWTARIEARVQAGALTADQATTLRTQLATRAKDMVYRTTLGGMQGAAVGAGPNAAAGRAARHGCRARHGRGPERGAGRRARRGHRDVPGHDHAVRPPPDLVPRRTARPAEARPSAHPCAMARILVVDDEPRIVDVVRAYLEREGHAVEVAHDGDTALAVARATAPDLVVLDVMLPRQTGFDVLRALRADGAAGPAVILLTARDDVIDRVAGLELGADDYVTKPFEPRELVARVGAVLRRLPATGALSPGAPPSGAVPSGAPPSAGPERLPLADLEVDPLAREVTRAGSPIELTRTEFDLLLAFAEQPDRAWTREQLGSPRPRRGVRRLRPVHRQPRQEPPGQARRAAGRRRLRRDGPRHRLPGRPPMTGRAAFPGRDPTRAGHAPRGQAAPMSLRARLALALAVGGDRHRRGDRARDAARHQPRVRLARRRRHGDAGPGARAGAGRPGRCRSGHGSPRSASR